MTKNKITLCINFQKKKIFILRLNVIQPQQFNIPQ